jgi:propionate CoA-transferase
VRLKEDVLDNMGFEPEVADHPRRMDARIFRDGPMAIRDEILARGRRRAR